MDYLMTVKYCMQAFGDMVYPVMFGGDKPGQDKADKLTEVLGWVDGFVAGDKFCAGTSQITIADIAFLATYSTLKVTPSQSIFQK